MTNRSIAAGDLLRLVCLAAANPDADPGEVLAIVDRTAGDEHPADVEPEVAAGAPEINDGADGPAKPTKPE